MAKPPRQSGRKVSFTREAAERIVAATLKVEAGGKDMSAIGRQTSSGGDELVRGTFSGTWAKGTTKTVADSALSAVTYEARNYQANLAPTGNMECHLAYAAGEWVLVSFDYTALPGYSGGAQQILAHNEYGQLVWLNTTACA